MKELFLLLVNAMSREQLFESLSEAVSEHKLIGSEETGKKVEMYCNMYALKSSTESKGIEKLPCYIIAYDNDFNVATYCFTAYPTVDSHKGKGLYLVQHYEPLFFNDKNVAKTVEATYKLPLKRLCVSEWLTKKVGGVNIGNGIDLSKFKKHIVHKNVKPKILALTVKENFKRPELLTQILRARTRHNRASTSHSF